MSFPRTVRKKIQFNPDGDINQPGAIQCGGCSFKAKGQNALDAMTVLLAHFRQNNDAAHRNAARLLAEEFKRYAAEAQR